MATTVPPRETSRCKFAVTCVPAVWFAVSMLLAPLTACAQAPPQTAPKDPGEFGAIGTEVYQVRAPNGRLLVIRGKLHNPYDEPVDGVRLVIRLLTAGEQPRELDRIERELDVTIQPNGARTFNHEVATAYAYTFSSMAVVAFAKHRGAAEFPSPAHELENQASTGREVFLFTGNVPIVTSPVITSRP